jgi:hypothetical protein
VRHAPRRIRWPLLDIPVMDPAVTTIAGGELLVAAGIYAFGARARR